jgi:creatinine amidohydrolase
MAEFASLHFADLSYPDVQALLDSERATVLLLPVGSTEPHGPHSPLRTDPIISMGMCERAARQVADDATLRALILPPLGYGVTRFTRSFPGPIHVSEEVLHGLLVDICSSLIDEGFPHVLMVNNHFEPEHVQTLHRAADTVWRERAVTIGYLDLTRKERASRLTEEFRAGGSHAGRYETALVLADHPELVNEDRRRTLPEVPVNLASSIAAGHKEFVEMGLVQAYNGDPAAATAAEGERIYKTLTEMLVSQMRALVAGTGGRDLPGLYGRV